LVCLSAVAQGVQNDPWLNSRESRARVELKDLVHILCEIQYNGDIAALASQACTGPSGKNGSAVLPARRHGRDHICIIAGHHQADGNLPVIRPIGGVERSAAAIESNFPFYYLRQFFLELHRGLKNVNRLCMRTERKWWELHQGMFTLEQKASCLNGSNRLFDRCSRFDDRT